MEFVVPQGCSSVCEIKLEPAAPVKGKAQKWKMTDATSCKPEEIDTLDMVFSKESSMVERQVERMILAFTIHPSSNTGGYNWRFFGDGLLYCDGKEDYLERMRPEIANNGKTLILTVKCLSDLPEDFNFSFLAMRQDKNSGECHLFSSEDPGGSTKRHGGV